jgi:hypothetical protein
MKEGSLWFKRLMKDIKKIDPYLRVKRAKMGFYRIFWKQAYVHEVYKECPMIGYDFEIDDPSNESQKYFEELEDGNEITRKIKNYKEGYFDSLDRIKTRVWLLRHNKEFNESASKMYNQMIIR